MPQTPLHALWMGLTGFEKSLQIQSDLLAQSREYGQHYVVGLEHPPTITLGKRAKKEEDILWQDDELLRRGLEVFQIERGGEATLHAPGQLVIYPVMNLHHLRWGVREYLSILTDVTRTSLSEIGIPTTCAKTEPGLFTPQGKLVAFGVRIKHGVTQHGLAINCSNSLQLFESIRSCGVKNQKWTHLNALGINISPRDLFKIWHRQFLLTIPGAAV